MWPSNATCIREPMCKNNKEICIIHCFDYEFIKFSKK